MSTCFRCGKPGAATVHVERLDPVLLCLGCCQQLASGGLTLRLSF